jgi:hypothetical protein
MATTGWSFKGKFYPYGSELPEALRAVLKERGLDEMGNPVKQVETKIPESPVAQPPLASKPEQPRATKFQKVTRKQAGKR